MPNRKGFFETMVEARSRQARAYVNGALLMLDDKTLAQHGYNRDDLKKKPSAYYPL